MDIECVLTILLLFLSSAACLYLLLHKPNPPNRKQLKLPPGPFSFPIIGNILVVGNKPHRSLAKLSKIHGPLMHLKLGSLTTIVVSSSQVAKIVLQKYDQVFSNRPSPCAVQALDHHLHSIAWRPADNQWRKLRKICKEKLFSVQKLDANQSLRSEKLSNLWNYVNECCVRKQVVDIGRAAFTTSLNLLSSSLFSMDLADFDSDLSRELKENVCGIMEYVGKPNLADFFPVLRVADPQGIFRKSTFYFEKCFEMLDEIIVQRVKTRGSTSRNDMLEDLLDLSQTNESGLGFDDIKHLLLDLFVAGTDTTSGTIEWAMSELIRNPKKMLKARNELRSVIGHNEQIQESEISKLSYLQAVVKETFRLHPPAPFLLPHKANEDIEINGHLVPKNAQVLVNVWAIGRESNIWSNPDSFIPERFFEKEVDFFGKNFELIPFGGGRRICPGLPLAYRMVHLMLANLINNFDWKLEQGLKFEELDMTEKFGFSPQKAIPLKAVPIKV